MKAILKSLILLSLMVFLNACGMIGDTEKEAVLADAMMMEDASVSLCEELTCADDQTFTYGELKDSIVGFNEAYYEITDDTVVSELVNGFWFVNLEAKGTGEWEFQGDSSPRQCDESCIVKDQN